MNAASAIFDTSAPRSGKVIWALRAEVLAVALITVVAAAVRFPDLGAHSLWLDEVTTADSIASFKAALLQRFHPPAHYVLLWAWTEIFGNSRGAMRSLSALFGTATIPLLYVVARGLFQRRGAALMVALFATFMPALVHFSCEMRMYPIWIFFFLLALWGVMVISQEGRLTRKGVTLYAVGIVFGQLSHHYMVFYSVALAISAFLALGDHPIRKRWPDVKAFLLLHAPIIFGAVLVLARLLMTWKSLEGIIAGLSRGSARGKWSLEPRVLGNLMWFDDWVHRSYTGLHVAMAWGLVLALCVAVVALFHSPPRRDSHRVNRGYAHGIMLLVLLVIPYVAIDWPPIRDYARLMAPTAALIALGIGYLLWLPVGAVGRVGWCYTAALCAALTYNQKPLLDDVYSEEVEPWETMCAQIDRGNPGKTLVLITARDMVPALKYCHRRKDVPIIGFSDPRKVQALAKDYDKVWVVYSHTYSNKTSDKRRRAVGKLKSHFKVTKHHKPGRAIEAWEMDRFRKQ